MGECDEGVGRYGHIILVFVMVSFGRKQGPDLKHIYSHQIALMKLS